VGLLLREVGALYAAFSQGRPSPLAELPVQYADFTLWQRQFLSGATLENQLDYWKKQLEGAPQAVELPFRRVRPATQSFHGRTEYFVLDRKVTAGLKELSQSCGSTLFMTMMAAYACLLSRYTGREDIVVGSPVANRNRTETEPLIGFFVNTLALRFDLSGDPAFRELVNRVRGVTLDALSHQDLPFEKLVEELNAARELNRNPLVQVVFALQHAPAPPEEMGELRVRRVERWNSGLYRLQYRSFQCRIHP
jgi:hypothetical protein